MCLNCHFTDKMDSVKDALGKWGKKAAETTKKAEDLAGNMWQHCMSFAISSAILPYINLLFCLHTAILILFFYTSREDSAFPNVSCSIF